MYTYLSLKHLWYTRLFSHMNETHAQIMLFDQTFIAFLDLFLAYLLIQQSRNVSKNQYLLDVDRKNVTKKKTRLLL